MRHIRHHVENDDAPALLERTVRPLQNVDDLLRRLLMERSENRDDVIGLGLVLVRMIIACTALDAVRQSELRDIAFRLRADRRQVDRHARHPRIRLAHQNRIRARSTREIQNPDPRTLIPVP